MSLNILNIKKKFKLILVALKTIVFICLVLVLLFLISCSGLTNNKSIFNQTINNNQNSATSKLTQQTNIDTNKTQKDSSSYESTDTNNNHDSESSTSSTSTKVSETIQNQNNQNNLNGTDNDNNSTNINSNLNDNSDSEIKDTGNLNDLSTQRYYFDLGIKSFENKNYVEAQYYLEKIKNYYLILNDYIKFYIAKSMLMQKKYDLAIENYKNLINEYPQSIFQEKANIELADAYYLSDNFTQAEEYYKLFNSKFPSSDLIPYSIFQMGVCEEKINKLNDAYNNYKKIYLEYPASDYAKLSLDNLTRLSKQNGLPEFLPTINELSLRADKLFSIYYYDLALIDYNKIISQNEAANAYPQIYSKALFKIGMCYFNMADYNNSLKYLKLNYEKFPTNEYADDSLYYIGRSLTNLDSYEEAIQTYKRLLERFPQSNYADDSLYRCGRIAYTTNDWKTAAAYFQRSINEYPNGDKLSDAYWELGWIQYRLKEYENAASTFNKMSISFKGDDLEGKSLFWEAKCLEKLSKNTEAIDLYKKVFSINPFSYYGFASAEILKQQKINLGLPEINKNLNPQNSNISTILPEIYKDLIPHEIKDKNEVNHINKAKELLYIKFFDSAAKEVQASKSEMDANPQKILEISTMYLKSNDYENSIKIIQQNYKKLSSSLTGNLKDYYYYLFYPFAYKDILLKYSNAYNVEPNFLLAIIREESRFKADAGSYAGAQGLMQIMPKTGISIASKIGISNFNVSMLHDPEISIKMGSYYISQMLNNFNGNKYYALGAYNGGPNAMQNWIAKYGNLDINEFIESLTYEETKNYIKKVMASYFVYELLYP